MPTNPYFMKGEEEFFETWLHRRGIISGSDAVANWVFLFRKGVYAQALEHFGCNPTNADLVRWLANNGRKYILNDFRRQRNKFLRRNFYLGDKR